MLSQDVLNSLPLKEASDLISDTLINERKALRERRAELDRLKAQYQEDYIAANDGDARENAPLEQAIQNLKTVTGDILAITKKYQSLDAVEDQIYLNATYDYESVTECIKGMSETSARMLFTCFNVKDVAEFRKFLEASDYDGLTECVNAYDSYYGDTVLNNMHVDFPDDSPIWKSRSEFDRVVVQRRADGEMAFEYKILMELSRLREMKAMPPYNYCGKIVMYTTVRLRMQGMLYTYRIYPKGLSFIDDGVMAANARLASALMGKRAGETVNVRHLSRDKILVYEILDIY